jgi:DNA-binding LytR/AlgR family response regulator
MKLLIIEDDLLTADNIKTLLTKNNHEVKMAKNSLEAIKLAEAFWPNLAIVDIHLKQSSSDGIGIANILKKTFNIPIIFLTGKSDPSTFSLAKAIQPLAYLIKPFNPQELVFQVELAYEHFIINQPSSNPLANESVYFPDKNGHKKVEKKDVSYIKASGNFTFLYLNENSQIILTGNLGYYAQFFPSSAFFQCHRSYIINLEHINRIIDDTIYLKNFKEAIPLAASRKAEFLKRICLVRTPG